MSGYSCCHCNDTPCSICYSTEFQRSTQLYKCIISLILKKSILKKGKLGLKKNWFSEGHKASKTAQNQSASLCLCSLSSHKYHGLLSWRRGNGTFARVLFPIARAWHPQETVSWRVFLPEQICEASLLKQQWHIWLTLMKWNTLGSGFSSFKLGCFNSWVF